MRVRAYGKLNLTLHVVGTRVDGYHLLHSWVQSVDVFDELHFTVDDGGETVLEVEEGAVPTGSANLAWRAAEALRRRSGRRELGVRIRLRKGIPVAGGMGGGSADAAATLYALNRLWDLQLAPSELSRLGLGLGADIPFCLQGGLALMEGIGERITAAVPPGSLPLVVLNPDAQLSTAEVYRLYDRLAPSPPAAAGIHRDQFLSAWRRGPQELAALLHNDLEMAAVRLCPEVGRAKAALQRAGALAAVMSGSGPTVFGLARDDDHLRWICRLLRQEGWNPRMVSVQTTGLEEV